MRHLIAVACVAAFPLLSAAQGVPPSQPGSASPNTPTYEASEAMAMASPAPPAFAPGSAEATASRPRGPVRISGGVMAGNVRSKVDPVYPTEARSRGLEGSVLLSALIGKNGAVRDLKVVSGSPALVSAAIDAVKQWTYKPFLLNGQPTEVLTTVTVNFRLHPSSQP